MIVVVLEIREPDAEDTTRAVWSAVCAAIADHPEWRDRVRATLHIRESAERIVAVIDARYSREPDP